MSKLINTISKGFMAYEAIICIASAIGGKDVNDMIAIYTALGLCGCVLIIVVGQFIFDYKGNKKLNNKNKEKKENNVKKFEKKEEQKEA